MGIPDSYNEYRLGTIFLQNFYVGLDYEYDSLLIGLRADNTDAEIHGAATNPFKKVEDTGPALIFVVIFLVVLVLVAIACYIRSKRIEKQREVYFDGPSSVTDPTETEAGKTDKPRYKNGVEIKPSEAAQLEKQQKEKLLKKQKKKKASPMKKEEYKQIESINATVDREDGDDEEQALDDEEELDRDEEN